MKIGHIFNIMVGSPGDVTHIAKRAIECINNWNILNSYDKSIALVPHHWTSSSYPSLRKPAQAHIDDILVERSDALVAIFGSRLGTPTNNYISGTVEEIEKHRAAEKPVMVFFSETLDFSQDVEQLKNLQEYRNQLSGLYETYNGIDDFEKKFSAKLHLQIQNEFQPLVSESVSNSKGQETISFSEEEVSIMKRWCDGKVNQLSQIYFMGGTCLFRFGTVGINAESPKEVAQLEDFINRLYSCGFIDLIGYDKHSHPKYKLNLKAYNTFSEVHSDNMNQE
ncbi:MULTISPECIES: hypothetical protein [Bacteroides]|uniref:hypothetical protein n=1 Tax=Bacteroides TaxID=816 RepID=UPI00267718D7|nr:hypothetical protein [Bacteroides acidifaciens]